MGYLEAAAHTKLDATASNISASSADTEIEQHTTLLIEGWRGLSHSYGLVNQFQILELLKISRLRLFHHDLPFFNKTWNRSDNDAHFPMAAQQKIDAIPPPADNKIDCVYRISSPIVAGAEDDRRKTLTFMITEMGMTPSNFAVEPSRYPFFTRDENAIVTTTRWSRDRIVEFGFPAEKIHILPLGADLAVFHPITQDERAATRAGLGIRSDEILFVNVGGTFWNKGGDLLLRAFAHLRTQGRPVRLIVKDQRSLYGIPFETAVETVAKDCPALRDPRTTNAISVIGGDLSRAQLRDLYAIADCYVSPYRAEGFNLPVLEAIACGTPVIVTEGGATDDFCPDGVALRIPGRPGSISDIAPGVVSRYIEPDLDALIAAMTTFAEGRRLDEARFAQTRAQVMEAFSWQRAARGLAALAAGRPLSEIPAEPAPSSAQPIWMPAIRQQDILELMRTIRPHRMASTQKVRIGNDYDGGYVLPETALGCDVVLSVGVGNDVSFDLHMAERGAAILQFDHTVEQPPTPHPNFVFQKLGWGSRTEGSFLNFDDICAQLTPLGARRRLLKFDIEGAEYDVFDTVDPDSLATFEVITCEIHDLDKLGNPAFFEKVKRFLGKLTLHHVPIHLHGNNYRRFAIVEGVPIPEVLEISLLRRDLDTFPDLANDPIPGPLDRPNHPFAPDMCLTPFK
jgi:glycosyltransferase involved in cell wall biosynthesis